MKDAEDREGRRHRTEQGLYEIKSLQNWIQKKNRVQWKQSCCLFPDKGCGPKRWLSSLISPTVNARVMKVHLLDFCLLQSFYRHSWPPWKGRTLGALCDEKRHIAVMRDCLNWEPVLCEARVELSHHDKCSQATKRLLYKHRLKQASKINMDCTVMAGPCQRGNTWRYCLCNFLCNCVDGYRSSRKAFWANEFIA